MLIGLKVLLSLVIIAENWDTYVLGVIYFAGSLKIIEKHKKLA